MLLIFFLCRATGTPALEENTQRPDTSLHNMVRGSRHNDSFHFSHDIMELHFLCLSIKNGIVSPEYNGLGPEINLPIILNEKLICAITARYQWEFDARSTLEGEAFNLYFNFPL